MFFFLLPITGGLIDYGHHMTRAKTACSETAEFARALETARSMSSDDETLIVVTSDHSHTMTVSGYPVREIMTIKVLPLAIR